MEIVAANMVAVGLEESLEIAAKPGEAIRRARAAAADMDATLAPEVLDWVTEAQRLLQTARHPLVHGLVHYAEDGSWQSLHMKTGQVSELNPTVLETTRGQLENHVALGLQLNWRVWRERKPSD